MANEIKLDKYFQIDPSLFQKARQALGEDDDLREQCIRIMRQWIEQQPHFHTCSISDYVILAFIRGCKFSLEKAKRKMDLTFSMRANLPEFFSNWDPLKPEIRAILECGSCLPLHGYDQLGRKVIVYRPGQVDPYLHRAEDVEKTNFMISDLMGSLYEQMFITGIVVIIDLEGYSLGHVTQRPLSVTKKHMQYLQEAAPLSPKSLNFVNTTSAFQAAHSMISGVLNDKMKQRFKVHGSDYDSLHKEVHKDVLPPELGGTGASLAEMTDYWKTKVIENRDLLRLLELAAKCDESRRPGKPKTSQELFGIEGSFRKLSVD